MNFLYLLPPIVSALLIAGHFLRSGNVGLMLLGLAVPFILFIRRLWIVRVFQALLIIGSLIWISAGIQMIQWREIAGQPWTRLAVIMGIVALFTIGSASIFETKRLRSLYQGINYTSIPSLPAFTLTAVLLAIVQMKVHPPMIILERFLPGGGWLEIFVLSIYAGFITEKMQDAGQSALWRHRIWSLFSIIFFAQLIIGVLGVDKFLMTGKLHLPVPALIVAGPIFRGGNYFMPILFAATVLIIGPAWCSHLCYIGAWDDIWSRRRKKPGKMPLWRQPARIAILALVIAAAIVLRAVGVSTFAAGIAALSFGLIGVTIMVLWSQKAGVMTHCVTFCPIGPLANWLGKISPFRIKINNSTCTDCTICHVACRYDALNDIDVKKRKPGISCTLCGDCIGTCRNGSMQYYFPGMNGKNARTLFIVLIVSLHAVFMGVARM